LRPGKALGAHFCRWGAITSIAFYLSYPQALYIYKGIYFYATLYAIYTVIAYLGYRKWLRLMPTPR
jgi:hypothetical protein